MKSLLPSLSLIALAPFVLAVGCGEESLSPADAGGGGTAPGTGGSGGAPDSLGGAGGAGGVAPPPSRATVEGDVTWTVTFDDAAKAAGAVDCSYTRHYKGAEDESAPWLCPDCEVAFKVDVEMTAGKDDCFLAFVSPGTEPVTEEYIGYGAGTYYRGYFLTSEQGTAAVTSTSMTVANTIMDQPVMAGGTLSFEVAGSFTIGTEQADPLNGFTPPATYACGWPKANPALFTGPYTANDGDIVPDGVFMDKCDEPVRLHDFKGSYVIVDMAAIDCPPCQAMADDEEGFVAEMAAQGIDVKIITLLAPSLDNTLGHTTQHMLESWTSTHDLTTSVVLADRGWGLSMFIPRFGDQVGYPSWVVADKDMKILTGASGYDQFASAKAAILADAP